MCLKIILVNSPVQHHLMGWSYTGLSLRARGWRFSLATMSKSRGYSHRKQKENKVKSTSLLYNSPPTKHIYLVTWNFSDSPSYTSFLAKENRLDYIFNVHYCVEVFVHFLSFRMEPLQQRHLNILQVRLVLRRLRKLVLSIYLGSYLSHYEH